MITPSAEDGVTITITGLKTVTGSITWSSGVYEVG